MNGVPEELLSEGSLMDCVSAAREGQGHALEAQGTWFVPVPHPGSPLHCTRLSQYVFLLLVSRPSARGPRFSCFLNQGLTASAAGSGNPQPWDGP